MFTHELWRLRNRTSERGERVLFLIQNNEYVNTVQSTFYVVLCLLYTYWDWTSSLNYDKLYLNKSGQTTITERKQLRIRKKRKSSNNAPINVKPQGGGGGDGQTQAILTFSWKPESNSPPLGDFVLLATCLSSQWGLPNFKWCSQQYKNHSPRRWHHLQGKFLDS